MRDKGIHYDTGLHFMGRHSRPSFDPGDVEREMGIIAGELHCDAIRIIGDDPGRIDTAARLAAAEGLRVWYSPFPCEMTEEQMLPYFTDCARRAECLRREGADVVLVTGCELSMFARGYLPGDTFADRIKVLTGPDREATLRGVPQRVNAFLGKVTDAVRPVFRGPVTYASSPLDGVDWAPFDIVGLDAFRSLRNAATYREDLRKEFAHGKPVAVLEVGCCTFRGAGDHGGAGWYVAMEPDGVTLRPDLVRDEGEQVRYIDEIMPVLAEEGVDSVFWFSFLDGRSPHRTHGGPDLDMASYSIVKLIEEEEARPSRPGIWTGLPWEPKEAFHALAGHYARLGRPGAGAPGPDRDPAA
ncbi:hypothetical protein [Streptomyces sp. NPDC059166]|uniref:hypothetical protein n=1 Tax=Streptomyces sp. NPDC059166 TaxID=3346752 RepID=UPI00367DA485